MYVILVQIMPTVVCCCLAVWLTPWLPASPRIGHESKELPRAGHRVRGRGAGRPPPMFWCVTGWLLTWLAAAIDRFIAILFIITCPGRINRQHLHVSSCSSLANWGTSPPLPCCVRIITLIASGPSISLLLCSYSWSSLLGSCPRIVVPPSAICTSLAGSAAWPAVYRVDPDLDQDARFVG